MVLAVGADQLVIGASRLALARGISPIVIGALVIGFGTSAPEMLVSGLAAADGKADLGVGNIVGSNVANLSLVLGFAALVAALAAGGRRIRVARSTLWREGMVAVVAAVLFWVLIQDGFQRWEGVVLAVAFVLSMTAILRRPAHAGKVVGEVARRDKLISQPFELGRTVLGLTATVTGAQLAVEGAVDIAQEVGLGTGFVGLSLVAFGTSLPELITGVQAGPPGGGRSAGRQYSGLQYVQQLAGGRAGGAAGPRSAGRREPVRFGGVDHGGHFRRCLADHVPG